MIRVLFVDDERLLLDLSKEFLEQQEEDFRVDTAISAEEALQRLSEEEYDAVASDYKMPGMDGLGFLSELRKRGNSIPFIMFTGRGREEVAVEAFRRGADGYVMKGGEPTAQYAELANSIRQAVNRRKVEEALRESEERYRALVELAHDGVMRTEGQKRIITFANRRMAEMLGYSVEEVVGKSYRDLVHPDENEDFLQTRRYRIMSGEISSRERRLVKKDGSSLYTLASASSVDPNDKTESSPAVVVFTDISDRKRMEEALQRSEERYRTLVELAHNGVMLTEGPKRTISFTNERMAEMLGYSVEELVGKSYMDLIHPDFMEQYLQDRKSFFVLRRPSTYETAFIKKDGSTLLTLTSVSPVNPEDESEEAPLVCVFTDITERKRIEDRERYLHSLLRHDLANKFQGAYGYLELLKRTTLKGKQEEYVENLQESLQDTTELIEMVRFLRTIDETKENAVLDLDLAIRDAIEDVSSLAEEHGIAIDYEGIPNVMTTASPLLKNAFANLIQNSIKHAECDKITITVRERKDRYHVTVQDNGKGIPDKVKEKLFERGVKGPGSTGSGLGLHLVKRIIEASKGTIKLKDSKKGARFDIYLTKAGAHKQ